MSETRARSAVKSLSWRVVATATTVGLVLAFTGELRIAVAVGVIEVVAKLVIFYAHERVWDRVRWGEQRP